MLNKQNHNRINNEVSNPTAPQAIADPPKNMPSYAHQITPRVRWAIIAYIKALQISGEEK